MSLQNIARTALWPLVAITLLISSCQKERDDKVMNQAPGTTANLREVTLDVNNRDLVSSVRVYWSGFDADGYVRGYQFRIDDGPWSAELTRTDSLFRFPITNGTDQQTIAFYVRAVDDKGEVDATPDTVILPLRNQPPTVRFDGQLPGGDSLFSPITLPLLAADPDGNETIDSFLIRVNGGAWFSLPKTTTLISILPDDPSRVGPQTAKVYRQSETSNAATSVLLPGRLSFVVVGGNNLFEIKAVDIAGTSSPIITLRDNQGGERPLLIKQQTSDLLVIDSHQGTSPRPEPIYYPVLNAAYPRGYDLIDYNAGKGKNQPRYLRSTLPLLLGSYKKVFWFMDDTKNASANRYDSTSILLESVAPILSEYLNQGGNLLLTTKFPDATGQISLSSPAFNLVPADSITKQTSSLRLSAGSVVAALKSDLPPLEARSRAQGAGIIDGIDVFFPNGSADSIYAAPVTKGREPFTRTRIIAARRTNQTTGKPNFYFFSMELHQLSGNDVIGGQNYAQNFQDFFSKVLNQDFN